MNITKHYKPIMKILQSINKILFRVTIMLILTFNLVQSQVVKFKIIETSDVHGAIFPYNFTSDMPSSSSLAHVHSYVKQERKKEQQQVILIDNGDILQGDPSVYYYNFERTDTTHLLARVMNYMNYDVATVGNHDIETGHPVYDKFLEELDFPWLAANAIDISKKKPYFQPYHIIERNDIRIAVLGLITPGIPNWLPPKIWSGMKFDDMIITAKKWVSIILEKENPDLLIGLFHAGVDHTYDGQSAETPRNENASQLVAELVPGFDIVFVGHDHQVWNYKVENSVGDSVLILGPSSRSRSVAVANINFIFDKDKNSWNSSASGEIVKIENLSPDEAFMNNFSEEFEIINAYVSRPIGKFSETISARESIFGNSSFVDLIHKIQLELTEADLSFTAPLSLRSEIKKGPVYVKDMFNLYRYENLLYTMELTGQEILDYLEYSYGGWFNTMKSKDDHLLLFEKDAEGNLIFSNRSNAPMLKNRYYNFDSAEGINYTVDLSKPAGNRISVKSFTDGTPFTLSEKYKVAINSYRGNGGGGHLTKGAGISKNELTERIIESTEKDLRYYMMKWIEEQKSVSPVQIINWSLQPSELVKEAIERDDKLLFGN